MKLNPKGPMVVTLAVSLPTDDYRALLQNLVDTVLDHVPGMTPELRAAVERAVAALERGTQ